MTDAPTEPGGFEGDIYYGDPIKTTMGTHRWQGGEWHELPSETEAVLGLLAKARTELAAALEREAALREALEQMRKRAMSTRGDQAYRELPTFIIRATSAALGAKP